MWRLGPVLPLALLAACQFSRPKDIDPIDARELDAVDAPPSCTPSTIVCDDALGVYTECDATGTVVRQLTCPLGCAADTEQCLDIDPHNGLAMYLDMARDDSRAVDITFAGESTISGAAGLATNGGQSVDTLTADTGTMRVFMFKRLEIQGVLRAYDPPGTSQPRTIALVADGEIIIDGLLDNAAHGALGGTGYRTTASATCDGGGSEAVETPPFRGAGGGGGYLHAGANGGPTGSLVPGFSGGARFMDRLEPLQRGCSGGTIFERGAEQDGNLAFGGGGGGAIQIVSRTRVVLRGQIDVSGGGGVCAQHVATTGPVTAAAGGGGGGTLLIEAPEIVLEGAAAVVSTKGGGGSAPGTCQPINNGGDGGVGPTPAAGGVSDIDQFASGGAGGASTTPPQVPPPGAADAGGGGGAAGVAAIFTRLGVLVPQDGASVQGHLTVDAIRVRRVP